MDLFAPYTLFKIGPLNITNTLLSTFFIDGVIIIGIISLRKKLTLIPGIFQSAVELMIDGFYKLIKSVAEDNADKIFPFVMGFFIFIVLANLSELIPGIGTIGFWQGTGRSAQLIPLIRGTTTDLNTTLALTLVSFFATHGLAIRAIGLWKYLGRYFSFNPLNLFVGLLELISEITKLVSFSFRLFGNIFAGEILLGAISSISSFILPIPFLALEFIVAIVQALVFSLLTMAFMAMLMTPHADFHKKEHESREVNVV